MLAALQILGRITRIFPGKAKFFVVIILTAITAVLELAVSYSLGFLMDSVLGANFGTFGFFVGILLGITVVEALTRYWRNRLLGSYGEGGTTVLRGILAKKVVALPVKELDQRHTGDILTRMTNDMQLVRGFVNLTMVELIFIPLSALGALALLVSIHWKLTLVCLIAVPLTLVLGTVASGPVARYTRRLQEQIAINNSQIQDTITGIEVTRAFNMQESLSKRYVENMQQIRFWNFKLIFARSILQFLNSLAMLTPFVICFGLGGYWAIKGEMTAGQVIAFINLLNPLAGPIGEIPGILGQMRGQLEGARRVLEIVGLPDERQTGESFPSRDQGTVIAVKDVNFAYNTADEWVVNGLSFELKAGEKVAIVGPSGSGKSTIIKLLQGYYDNYEGDIRIYDHEISEWNLQEMRKNISFVSQDSYLFPGTIKENIAFGKIGATDQQIIAAAQEANAHEFIEKFPNSYETSVGEFGDKLSGGQKQRISIARAIIKEAPIILLDEATSSLDSHSEYLVQAALDEYMKQGKTALIIAHRLSTIQKADRILVIDNGQVVESGKHDELLNRDGVYRKLYLRQLAAQENEELAKEAVV